jgi:hypothetical protein
MRYGVELREQAQVLERSELVVEEVRVADDAHGVP